MDDSREKSKANQVARIHAQMVLDVLYGRQTWEFVEDLASSFSDVTFAIDPDPAAFDHGELDREFWTLGMSVAWLAWRTVDAVREHFPGFVNQRIGWIPVPESFGPALGIKPPNKPGSALVRDMPLPIGWQIELEAQGRDPNPYLPAPTAMSVTEAWRLLSQELRRGTTDLSGEAVLADDRPVTIPPADWDRVNLAVQETELQMGIDILARGDGKPAYFDVRLRRQAILRLADNPTVIERETPASIPHFEEERPQKRFSPRRFALRQTVARLWQRPEGVPWQLDPGTLVGMIVDDLKTQQRETPWGSKLRIPSDPTIRKFLKGLRPLN